MKVSSTAVAAAVVMAVAVDDEDSVQWRQRGGVFNGGWGLRIGDDKAMMEIDIISGGWRRRASAFDSGVGQR